MAARSSDGKLQELLGTLKTDGVEALDQLMDAYAVSYTHLTLPTN